MERRSSSTGMKLLSGIGGDCPPDRGLSATRNSPRLRAASAACIEAAFRLGACNGILAFPLIARKPPDGRGNTMQIETTALAGVLIVTPKVHADSRGAFTETFRQDVFSAHVPGITFVQDNQSVSARKGTVRGLHFQRDPMAQGKLVRCTRGAILDVAVDVREGSPTYGRHVAVELSPTNARQLWVPAGFLHGFCTLVDETEVIYKVTSYYSPAHDAGVLWCDPDLAIAWPVAEGEAHLSPKDAAAPRLSAIPAPFPRGV